VVEEHQLEIVYCDVLVKTKVYGMRGIPALHVYSTCTTTTQPGEFGGLVPPLVQSGVVLLGEDPGQMKSFELLAQVGQLIVRHPTVEVVQLELLLT